jgi:hypothetical protein
MMTSPAFMLVLAIVCLMWMAQRPAAAQGQRLHAHHIRPLDEHSASLIDDGLRRSPSLRHMIEHLSRSDVVVYVACGDLPRFIAGHLTWISAAGGTRYVSVRLGCTGPTELQVGILGHELQHAIEIADRPDIIDEASLVRAYSGFGLRRRSSSLGLVSFDSDGADRAGRRVRREVALRTD